MWASILVTGAVFIIGGLLQLMTGFIGGDTPAEIATVFFSAFIIAAVWNGINCRALDGRMPPFFSGNPTFFIVMGLVVLVQIAIVQLGGVIFNTVPLSLEVWARIIVLTSLILLIGFLLRTAYRRTITDPSANAP
jgi:Ca2+-transporting ATPase